jgi:ornithine cyclodeaminase
MKITTLEEINSVLPGLDLLPAIEAAFVAYSEERAVVPPVGELILEEGEVHIKYGYVRGEEFYVIKVASGFYGNAALGLPSGNGLMLLYRQKTGELVNALIDEGHLTDVRTAVAGAVAAHHLAPSQVRRIGIVGTGVQARLQLGWLSRVTNCRDALIWGRNADHAAECAADMGTVGFKVETTADASAILRECNLVVTTTAATEPILEAKDLRPGTHITAVGSDTPHKQELDAGIFALADTVVADSIEQCKVRGEIYQAVQQGVTTGGLTVELGNVIAGRSPGRTGDDKITVADLTGVAVQDMAIAGAVHAAL